MGKFNNTTNGSTATTNHEGATAFTMTPELELYSLVVTSLITNTFYESEHERLERLRTLVAAVKPRFVAQLAIYAREEMNLRTVPLVLLVELAKIHSGDNLVSSALVRVIKRPDELTETLSYYALANNREGAHKLNKLSNQLKKGLAAAFNSFDEYQFGKYNGKQAISLKDALFLVHPVPSSTDQQALFDKIATDSLSTPYTWETELSAKGNNKEVWTELVASKKLPYMATLRNLRNILNADVSNETLNTVAELISSPEEVRKSKQLPFRFLSAYRELGELNDGRTQFVLDALEQAIRVTAENIKGFELSTTVMIACDVSASMQKPISPRSTVEHYDIGLVLGMLLKSKCSNVITGFFGDIYKTVQLPSDTILQNVTELRRREGEVGYSTNGHEVIQHLIKEKKIIDKVMIFTDCQMWDRVWEGGSNMGSTFKNSWYNYKELVAPDAKLYLFDLSGYGSTPISTTQQDVYMIAGWSDKVFDMLSAYEQGGSAIKQIQEISI